VLTTVDADGARQDRVLERLEGDGRVYVASNHWLRGWYHAALANPSVRMTFGGKTRDHEAKSAVPRVSVTVGIPGLSARLRVVLSAP
jgi:hypothetical protein